MELHRWYKRVFRNGDERYFFAERRLQDGEVQGVEFVFESERPSVKPEGKVCDVRRVEEWIEIADGDVPIERFALPPE